MALSMKFIVGFLAFVALSSAFAVESDGDDTAEYIVGGRTAKRGQFPFMVSLRTAANSHFCGGAIISNNWVLSAAHCMQNDTSRPRNVFAWVGAHSRRDGVRHAVNAIINHPQYHTELHFNDICVIRTSQPIQYAQGRIEPLRLPRRDTTVKTNTWIAGWGLTGVSLNTIPLIDIMFNEFFFCRFQI